MASVRDARCSGLMLVRKVTGKTSNRNDNKNNKTGKVTDALEKLQMIFLEDFHGHFILPRGQIGHDESEMMTAQRVTQEAIGFTPEDYTIFQEFSFVLEDMFSDCKKTIYWVAILNETEKLVKMSEVYKNFFWFDFSILKTLGRSGIGKLQTNLNHLLENFAEASGELEQALNNRGFNV